MSGVSMSMVVQVVVGLITAFLGFLFGQLWRKGSTRMRETSLHQFWSFTNNRIAIVFPMYGDPRYGPEAPKTMARIEDVLAIAKITRLLNLAGFQQDYRLVDDNRDLQDAEDLILVCSPFGNKQSRNFASQVQLPFEYVSSRPCFRDTETNTEFTAAMDTGGGDADIALVAKLTQTNPKRTVFLFWGLHGIGTLGSVGFSVDRKNMAKIDAAVRKDGGAFLLYVPFHRIGDDDKRGLYEAGQCKVIVSPRRFDPKTMKWLMN